MDFYLHETGLRGARCSPGAKNETEEVDVYLVKDPKDGAIEGAPDGEVKPMPDAQDHRYIEYKIPPTFKCYR